MFHGVYASYRERRDSLWSGNESGNEDLTNSCSMLSADIKTKQDELTKAGVDLSYGAEMQESSGVLRNMIDIEKEIHEHASVSLSDLMLGYEKTGHIDFTEISELLLRYMDKDGKGHNRPLSRFRNKTHNLNSITSTGVTRNMILGLYELVQFKVRDDISESKIFEQLDPRTFSFNNTPRMWGNASEHLSGSQFKDAKGSRTYVFVAALKFFVARLFNSYDGLTPETFCALNRLLTSKNEDRGTRRLCHSEWYITLSAECQCEEGAHSWLIQFIDRINSYNEINKLDPIYEISRLYLAFVERDYFGKHSKEIGMILIQSLALKWMHYVSIPFDEKEKEFQNVVMMPSNTAAPRLAQFLEKALARNIGRILSRLSGTSFHAEDSSTTPVIEVTDSPVTVNSQDTNDRISSNPYASTSNTEFLLKGVSSSLESKMELQRLCFEDSFVEQKKKIAIRSPAFQFETSELKCCKTPQYRQDPHPTRRNSCEPCSANWLWTDGCDGCEWNLVDEDLSHSPRLVPTMRKQFSGAEIIKRGSMESLPEVKVSSQDGNDDLDSQVQSHQSTQGLLRPLNSDSPSRSHSPKIYSMKQSIAPEDSDHLSSTTITVSQNLRMHSQRSAKCNNSASSLDEDKITISRVSPILVNIMRDCSLNSS